MGGSLGSAARKLWKVFLTGGIALRHPSLFWEVARKGASELWQKQYESLACVPEVEFSALVPQEVGAMVAKFECRDGNVSPYELLVIASLVRFLGPRVVLEIGTFDGNTTLQMALNTPSDAIVYTLDLPVGQNITALKLESGDLRYIEDASRSNCRFAGHPAGEKIVQLFGDSATFDFRSALEGKMANFIFIDGSHSYEYVRNDTEKALQVLAPGGWFSGMTIRLGGLAFGDTLTSFERKSRLFVSEAQHLVSTSTVCKVLTLTKQRGL